MMSLFGSEFLLDNQAGSEDCSLYNWPAIPFEIVLVLFCYQEDPCLNQEHEITHEPNQYDCFLPNHLWYVKVLLMDSKAPCLQTLLLNRLLQLGTD